MNDQSLSPLGPLCYANWNAARKALPVRSTLDYPLFTDARLIDELSSGIGPYQILNAVPLFPEEAVYPGAFLRVEYHLVYESKVKLQTDVSTYHGGGIQDEIAALISLCLGIRLKAGGISHFYDPEKDPRGRPVSWDAHENPRLHRKDRNRPQIPAALGQHNLKDAVLVSSIIDLQPEDCAELIRAARLYQDAMWIAESEPELCWLLLVSAVETAANHSKMSEGSPLERMEIFNPELVKILTAAGGASLADEVSLLVVSFMGSTKKFRDFVLKFLPEPPKQRPAEFAQHSWDLKTMSKSLVTIYKWRSRALHGGIPFPYPMCMLPHEFHGGLTERPLGLSTMTQQAVWSRDDTPMLLFVFEYIVRNVLLSWWKSMIPKL